MSDTCFACRADTHPPPSNVPGHFVSHILAMVTLLGIDMLAASLCPKHADLYNACVEGGRFGIVQSLAEPLSPEKPS